MDHVTAPLPPPLPLLPFTCNGYGILPLLLACSRHSPSSFADTAMTEVAMKNRIVVCSKTDLRLKKAVDRQSARDFCRRVG
jgi:hypothetical protein